MPPSMLLDAAAPRSVGVISGALRRCCKSDFFALPMGFETPKLMREQLPGVLEGLELQGIARGVIQKESRLFTHLTRKADTGCDDELLSRAGQALGELMPC